MAKQVKRPQTDDAELIEPRSFEDLVERAHDAALSEDTSSGGKPSFWDCFNGNPKRHSECLNLPGGLACYGYLAMVISVVAWVATRGAGWVLPTDHGVVRFFAATAKYCLYGGFSAASLGWLGGYWSWRRSGRRCQADAAKTLDGPIAKHVTAYLGKLIAEEQRRCIGEGSEIERLRKRVKEALDRVKAALIRIEARVKEERYYERDGGTVPRYLAAAQDRAQRILDRLTRSSDRLSEHRAKLDAFFQECKGRVQAAEKPLQDLELVEAVEVLDAEGERLGTEVQEVIIRSTGELFGRLQQLRNTLGVSLAHAGVHLALTAPMTGNLERDARVLEDTIARFRPPKIVEGDDATAPRAQAGGPIGIT